MATKDKIKASAVAEVEIPTADEVGLSAKDIRKLKIQEFAQKAAAMNSAFWATGVQASGFQISQAANRLTSIKRDVHEQAVFRAQGKPDRLEFVRAEHDRLAAELASLEANAVAMNGPLNEKLAEAYAFEKSILDYAEQCRKEDGGDLDEVLVDWDHQDKLRTLATYISDCADTQRRMYLRIRAEIREKN